MRAPTPWLLGIFLRGVAMGAANVIPGVSGGTIAFISGIYERLINAIRRFGPATFRLLLAGRHGEFARQTDLGFLAILGSGVAVGILSLARVLHYLLERHAVFVWAFFFGLILASILFVGARVGRWRAAPLLAFAIGTAVAVSVTLLTPAEENAGTLYLLVCGAVAMASMIMPGLSGSFVLLLLGNYQLVMIDSVTRLTEFDPGAFRVLLPVGIGAVIGLVTLSHVLSWVFRRFHDVAVALLTGFVAGSLPVIWPWKTPVIATLGTGAAVREKVVGYDWLLPDPTAATLAAVGVMAAGFLLVWLMERVGAGRVSGSDGATDA